MVEMMTGCRDQFDGHIAPQNSKMLIESHRWGYQRYVLKNSIALLILKQLLTRLV